MRVSVPTKVKWNVIQEVGLPAKGLRIVGDNEMPRTFLCRGEYTIFTSFMFSDGSGFAEEDQDKTVAWAVIDGF